MQVFRPKSDVYIINNLKIIQKKWFKSQQEMADSFGIKRTTWSSYIRGNARIPVWVLVSLCETTGLSINELMHDQIDISQIPEHWNDIRDGLHSSDRKSKKNVEEMPDYLNIIMAQIDKLAKKIKNYGELQELISAFNTIQRIGSKYLTKEQRELIKEEVRREMDG